MTSTSLKPKKSTKKWVYIGIGLALFALIAAGVGFWVWNKSKSSNKSDSADEEDEDISPEEIPTKIKEYRKKDWVDHSTALSKYKIPQKDLPTNISVSRAKDELLEALWRWGGEVGKGSDKTVETEKKKTAKILEKNAQRINLADKKGDEDDPLFDTKFLESIAEKYQQKNIFSSLPNQKKFQEGLAETKENLQLLREGFDLKYKSNKKIDWVASLWKYAKRTNNKTRAQEEKDFAKMTGYLERDANPFMGMQTNKFPSLTSLKELNQWTFTLAKKQVVASNIIYSRFYSGRRIGKKLLSPARGGIEMTTLTQQKNDNFGLKPVVMTFNLN